MICLDKTGEVRKRFFEFVTFKYARFVSGEVESYLHEFQPKTIQNPRQALEGVEVLSFSRGEEAHEKFMARHNG